MAVYKSKFTGKRIDNTIEQTTELFDGKDLESVNGIVLRDEEGFFSAAESHSEEEGGIELSLVTTGEKYHWNHDMIPYTEKGANSGVATLNELGLVPSTQLPSYVDDVIEVNTYSDLPNPGERGKIYVTLDTNLTYRWTGSQYTEISKSLALGETEDTAYRGDRGKVAYDHATAKGIQVNNGFYKIATNGEGHVTNTTAVAWSDLKALGAINGGSNSDSEVTITPTVTSVYSIESVGTANVPTILDTTKFDGGSLVFEQDQNDETHFTLTFTAASHKTGFWTRGTAAVMPTRKQVNGLWNGYEEGIDKTFAEAQTFTASS